VPTNCWLPDGNIQIILTNIHKFTVALDEGICLLSGHFTQHSLNVYFDDAHSKLKSNNQDQVQSCISVGEQLPFLWIIVKNRWVSDSNNPITRWREHFRVLRRLSAKWRYIMLLSNSGDANRLAQSTFNSQLVLVLCDWVGCKSRNKKLLCWGKYFRAVPLLRGLPASCD